MLMLIHFHLINMKRIELKEFIGLPVNISYLSKLDHPNISAGIIEHSENGFTYLKLFDYPDTYVLIRNSKINKITKL